jgi:hypothetical protein
MKLVITTMIALGVAVIITMIVIAFLHGWNFSKNTNGFNNLFFDTGNKTYIHKITGEQYIWNLHDYWTSCDRVNGSDMVAYIKENGTLSKDYIFEVIKNISWCDSLQSLEHACGMREDIVMQNITLPQVVKARCFNNSLLIN